MSSHIKVENGYSLRSKNCSNKWVQSQSNINLKSVSGECNCSEFLKNSNKHLVYFGKITDLEDKTAYYILYDPVSKNFYRTCKILAEFNSNNSKIIRISCHPEKDVNIRVSNDFPTKHIPYDINPNFWCELKFIINRRNCNLYLSQFLEKKIIINDLSRYMDIDY